VTLQLENTGDNRVALARLESDVVDVIGVQLDIEDMTRDNRDRLFGSSSNRAHNSEWLQEYVW